MGSEMCIRDSVHPNPKKYVCLNQYGNIVEYITSENGEKTPKDLLAQPQEGLTNIAYSSSGTRLFAINEENQLMWWKDEKENGKNKLSREGIDKFPLYPTLNHVEGTNFDDVTVVASDTQLFVVQIGLSSKPLKIGYGPYSILDMKVHPCNDLLLVTGENKSVLFKLQKDNRLSLIHI